MTLLSWCPTCAAPVSSGGPGVSGFETITGDETGSGFWCDMHGSVAPLWRAAEADYTSFVEVLDRVGELPLCLPWPLSPGWRICDVGVVDDEEADVALATVITVAGTSGQDGEVTVTVVIEEPHVGLGARVAHVPGLDPGTVVSGPEAVRVRADGHPVRLWAVPVPDGQSDTDVLARAALVGETGGRWMWLVISPASAALLLHDGWQFTDADELGPELVDLAFGGDPGDW